MTRQTLSLDGPLYAYYQAIAYREPNCLRALRIETENLPGAKMQIAPEQGQFLAFLVKLTAAKNVIEIGVFRGYSTLAMALVLPQNGQIIACDQDPHSTAIARQYWQQAGVSHKIELQLGKALDTLQNLLKAGQHEKIDLIFIDADKRNYDAYYEQSLQLLRPGGLMLIDNVLWHGKVADNRIQDKTTQSLRDFNLKLHLDQRVEISLIPIGDGLTLALKR